MTFICLHMDAFRHFYIDTSTYRQVEVKYFGTEGVVKYKNTATRSAKILKPKVQKCEVQKYYELQKITKSKIPEYKVQKTQSIKILKPEVQMHAHTEY